VISHSANLDHLIPAVVEAAGLPASPAGNVSRESGGIANHVYNIDDQYIVRIGTGSDGQAFDRTCAVMKAIEGSIPCQHLYYSNLSCDDFDFPVMVCEYVPGQQLKARWQKLTSTQQQHCMQQYLTVLDSLHRFDWRSISVFEQDFDWPSHRAQQTDELLTRASNDAELDQSLIANLRQYWSHNRDFINAAAPPVLIHGDANISNVLFDDKLNLTAIIDLDDCEVAPVEVEFWNMTFELMDEQPSPNLEQIKLWFRGFYDFNEAGSLTRLKLGEVYWNLYCLVEELSWRSKRTCREEAATDYQEIFVEDSLRDWFSQV
jgi:aminoglycoside phosphotransferase (APT) family kinase protein